MLSGCTEQPWLERHMEPPSETYVALREQWFHPLPPGQEDELPGLGKLSAAAAGMEMTRCDAGKAACVRAFVGVSSLGDASIYVQNHSKEGVGGYIGADGEDVDVAARKMTRLAGNAAGFKKTEQFPEINPEEVIYFVRAKDGTLYTQVKHLGEPLISAEGGSVLFQAGQDVIKECRLAQERAEKAARP